MNIELATDKDYDVIRERDRHLPESLVQQKIDNREIYMLRDANGTTIGWMRYGYFWDNTPFMNMIWIDEPYRGQGIGKRVVQQWEDEMRGRGYRLVMTSTQSNEEAQHFYRKLGYQDAGCLLLPNEPLEMIMIKSI